MIRSMTGFGDAAEQIQGVHYAVEVRSLNNRYFKASMHLPEELAALEAELESQLRRRFGRGSITFTLRFKAPASHAAHQVNDQALQVYLDHLETLHTKMAGADKAVNIDLTALLALPGVLQSGPQWDELLEQSRPAVAQLTEKACERLEAMRQQEGSSVARELQGHLQEIAQRLELIRQRAPQVVEEYHVRLKSRIEELLARAQLASAPQDLIHEVALFAEKADISEEVFRMADHLKHFQQILQSSDSEPAGRTLEFLSQEMLREANTIASKSNDAQVSWAVVETKGAIDRIREQVQNVE